MWDGGGGKGAALWVESGTWLAGRSRLDLARISVQPGGEGECPLPCRRRPCHRRRVFQGRCSAKRCDRQWREYLTLTGESTPALSLRQTRAMQMGYWSYDQRT